MLRLSKLADYAVVILLRLGPGGAVQTASGIAAATGIPEPTVAKVLKLLAAGRLAISTRGARGGYRLARSLEQVSVAAVIAAIDGPIALTACVDGASTLCEISGMCAVRGRWAVVNEAVRHTLDNISLAELHHPPRAAPPARPVQASVHPG